MRKESQNALASEIMISSPESADQGQSKFLALTINFPPNEAIELILVRSFIFQPLVRLKVNDKAFDNEWMLCSVTALTSSFMAFKYPFGSTFSVKGCC